MSSYGMSASLATGKSSTDVSSFSASAGDFTFCAGQVLHVFTV